MAMVMAPAPAAPVMMAPPIPVGLLYGGPAGLRGWGVQLHAAAGRRGGGRRGDNHTGESRACGREEPFGFHWKRLLARFERPGAAATSTSGVEAQLSKAPDRFKGRSNQLSSTICEPATDFGSQTVQAKREAVGLPA